MKFITYNFIFLFTFWILFSGSTTAATEEMKKESTKGEVEKEFAEMMANGEKKEEEKAKSKKKSPLEQLSKKEVPSSYPIFETESEEDLVPVKDLLSKKDIPVSGIILKSDRPTLFKMKEAVRPWMITRSFKKWAIAGVKDYVYTVTFFVIASAFIYPFVLAPMYTAATGYDYQPRVRKPRPKVDHKKNGITFDNEEMEKQQKFMFEDQIEGLKHASKAAYAPTNSVYNAGKKGLNAGNYYYVLIRILLGGSRNLITSSINFPNYMSEKIFQGIGKLVTKEKKSKNLNVEKK